MNHASVQGWGAGRRASLVLGVFLAAAVLALLAPGSSPGRFQEAAPKQKAAASPPAAEPAAYPKLNLTIVAKSPDVPEMVKVINSKIEEGWKANKVTPSIYTNDYEFIRRASLDIIGRVAKPEEIKEYLRDPPEKRRSLLIERLLASDEYPHHWANLWANWLLTRSGAFGQGPYKEEMTLWLEEQFAQNKPYSEIVQKVLTAKGVNTENGAVNFILAHVGEMVPPADREESGQFEMVPLTSRITRLFLGTQVQCAQCHDHPFYGSLKQEHFWGVNAFLRQVVREGTPPNLVEGGRDMGFSKLTLSDNPNTNASGKVAFEKRNGVILKTRAIFLPATSEETDKGEKLELGSDAPPRREQLARFVIEHPQFPRALVNRMWGIFFGRGFVNPVDEKKDREKKK